MGGRKSAYVPVHVNFKYLKRKKNPLPTTFKQKAFCNRANSLVARDAELKDFVAVICSWMTPFLFFLHLRSVLQGLLQ